MPYMRSTARYMLAAIRDVGAIWTKALRAAEKAAGIAVEHRNSRRGYQLVDIQAGSASGQWAGLNDSVVGFSFGCRDKGKALR